MGGIWGNAASMGLESKPLSHRTCLSHIRMLIHPKLDMPVEARGLFSGILQQGYALGYLVAAVFNLYIVPKSHLSFKSLFYIGAALTFAVALARLCFPESKQFLEQRAKAKANPELSVTGRQKASAFIKDARLILKEYWKRCLYACVLMGQYSLLQLT